MSRLQERITKYEIPKWPYEASFDRVLLFQIPTVESETFSGSLLYKPETTKKREKVGSPRAVIVSAGLKAMEILESNGIYVGDIVWFARWAMFRHELDATSKEFSIIRVGEITGCEDLSHGYQERLSDGFYAVKGSTTQRVDPEETIDS